MVKIGKKFLKNKYFIKHYLLNDLDSSTPGPGAYDPKTNINPEGQYYLSNFKSNAVSKFVSPDKSLTTSIKDSASAAKVRKALYRSFTNGTPGPGSYRIASEFGKYDLNDTGSNNNNF